MNKDRVKFSDIQLFNSTDGEVYILKIPKEKFESRSFICDLVGHQSRYMHNGNYKCIYCNQEADNHWYFPNQNKQVCSNSGHTFPDPNTTKCWRCAETVETEQTKEENEQTQQTQQTIDQINAMIRNVEDSLVDIKALVAGMMGK